MSKNISIIAFIAFFTVNLSAQTPAQTCSADSVYHLLDFWLGEWSITDTVGNDYYGSANNMQMVAGCAIQETWSDADNTDAIGIYFVDANRTWKHLWISSNATKANGTKESKMISYIPGKQAVFECSYPYKGITIIERTELIKVDDKQVYQNIIISFDGGKKWQSYRLGLCQKNG
jgi:hypothetical protein